MPEQPSVLQEIVSNKQKEVQQRKQSVPVENLLKDLDISSRSLEQALKMSGNRFILEYKRASPSRGKINSTLSVEEICNAYEGFADAVSVLTDSHYFDGSFDYLKTVRERLTVPVLCKDFVLEPYQVYEARYYGADAILLMLSVLDDQQYRLCAEAARKFNIDVLTEVHTDVEMQRAIALKARIIGINNRDLNTLKTNISVTERLADKAPSDSLIISESGISSRADVSRLSRYVNGFLVGTSLTAARDIRAAVKKLIFGEIKICGVRNISDAKVAETSGASYLGLVFYENSPRFLTTEEALSIISALKAKYVGVFVNEDMDKITELAKRLSLFAVQCHGNETVEKLEELREKLPAECQLWKAISYSKDSIEELTELFEPYVDRLIVDNSNKSARGGTGQRFDWQAIEAIYENMQESEKFILAGGINLKNIHELDSHVSLGLDISSGVEASRGVKSHEKIGQLFSERRRICVLGGT